MEDHVEPNPTRWTLVTTRLRLLGLLSRFVGLEKPLNHRLVEKVTTMTTFGRCTNNSLEL